MNGLFHRHASDLRLLSGSVLAVLALLACSAAGGKAAGGNGARASSYGGAGGSSTANVGGGAISGTSSGGGLGSSGGNDLILDLDAGPFDADAAAGCTQLNIGILGNPGSNDSSNFEQWLAKSGTSVKRIQTTADEAMTHEALAPFDVVVVDCLTRDYTADEATIFAAWVSAGGGLAAMSGYHDDTTVDWHANSLLAPLGVAYSGGLLWGPVTSFATHPITAGLTSVTFTGGYAVSDLGGMTSTRTPIAFLPGTPDTTVAFAIQMGAGHAFVWGDEWIEFDSEWSALPEIPQLWVQVFAWISPTSKCSLNPPQ
jgi:hypothetical protein